MDESQNYYADKSEKCYTQIHVFQMNNSMYMRF